MPESKKPTNIKKPKNNRSTDKPTPKKQSSPKKKEEVSEEKTPSMAAEIVSQIVPYLLFCLALFITVCFIFTDWTGIVGAGIRKLAFGLFSSGAIAIPLLILVLTVYYRRDREDGLFGWKVFFAFICQLFISVTIHAFTAGTGSGTINVVELFNMGLDWYGGGAAGGLIGGLLLRGIGRAGTFIVSFTLLAVFGLFLFGLTPKSVWVWFAYQIHVYRERTRIRRELDQAMPTRPHNVAIPPQPTPPQPTPPQPTQPPVEVAPTAPPARGLRARRKMEEISTDDGAQATFDAGKVEGEAVTLSIDTETGEVIEPQSQPDDEPIIDEAVFDEVLRKTQNGEYLSQTEEALNEAQSDKTSESEVETLSPITFDTPLENAPTDIPRRADGTIALEELFNSDEIAEDEQPNNSELNEAAIDGALHRRGDESASLEVERKAAVDGKMPPEKPKKPQKPYELPPVTLLKLEPAPDNTDVRDELQTTAKKLVDTLTSFKVRTRITNISRGPTITRYELAPEEGVRVRSIANLVDDISLNLATSGVRIEAPIPGKSAVGIEVPNRVVATVHLRELLASDKFKNAKSDITACLGMDVAGEAVFCDIAKMPHMLIAGTTGSGKSVCINSIIISLLYRASPDDMKLILVDPKKVELNVYNGLPHLLVPVVSDPKKAAGALHWAVTEMERRYELIENVGVRNLEGYNAYIADAPADENGNKPEKMSRIIIIIDELADLMMTAPDEIEESICRIAQKARAAGMHLIIGTQRPSVDVITGLIKANVPSRIAFTVSNMTDSRIIIDVGGAEKLIGRGDMLYSPIGSTKPIRVQGTFVSDDEVAAVCDFIKRQDYVAVYDDAVMNSIEEAAAMCGGGKKVSKVSVSGGSSSDDDGGSDADDSMLKPAIELAVESGKISTSLIQRRLSLGYGRAAKLIDRMQEMGIVSPPEGQKPRNVLITRQQYMEMVLNRDIE